MKLWELWGHADISVSGTETERYLKKCQFHGIRLYRLRQRQNGYIFAVAWKDAERLRRLAEHTMIQLEIGPVHGLGYFFLQARKRYYLLGFFLAVFALLAYCGQFIWHVTLEGNRQLTAEQLSDFLIAHSSSIGTLKSSVDAEMLENELRNSFPYITWISIQMNGTVLSVSVKENELELVPLAAGSGPEAGQNLICTEDGAITGLLLRSGVSPWKVGDEITSGEVIVEGQVPIYDTAGNEVIGWELVVPDAELTLKTIVTYREELLKSSLQSSFSGRRKRYPYLVAGNRVLEAKVEQDIFEESEQIRTFSQLWLFGGLYLPVYYGSNMVYELCSYTKVLSFQELTERLEGKYARYKQELSGESCQILSENALISEMSEGLVLEATLTVEKSAVLRAADSDIE